MVDWHESQRAQSVVDADESDVAENQIASQYFHVNARVRRAGQERAAVNPNQNGVEVALIFGILGEKLKN